MPIRKKLMTIIFIVSGMAIGFTCITFLIYQVDTYRRNTIEKITIIGKIISANSTAALAFDNHEDAREILSALKAEPHVVEAALYDRQGNLYSRYPSGDAVTAFPLKPGATGYHFSFSQLDGFQPVEEENRHLGTLYLKYDQGRLYDLLLLFGALAGIVIVVSLLLVYLLSRVLQKSISKPILALAETTRAISDKGDYSRRAVKSGDDELGLLTDGFNHMLEQIERQNIMLNEFNQDLEEKIRVRTSQLETVNSELESFSYSISHDLRAPLRSIAGFAGMLEENFSAKMEPEANRILLVIKTNTEKMGHLIDDLLSFSRIGRQEIKKTRINTFEMVKQVIAECAPQTNSSGIEWAVGSLPESMGDLNALRQVWINLISNAVKYSRNNSRPHIEIGSYVDPEKDHQVFFVRDNGAGFNEKYKNKLFKVFQRLHRADQFEGTGIGLAIVEKVISKHGGYVWAEAAVDNGACFYFSLPYHLNLNL
jgi:signal transduction histidine kinase